MPAEEEPEHTRRWHQSAAAGAAPLWPRQLSHISYDASQGSRGRSYAELDRQRRPASILSASSLSSQIASSTSMSIRHPSRDSMLSAATHQPDVSQPILQHRSSYRHAQSLAMGLGSRQTSRQSDTSSEVSRSSNQTGQSRLTAKFPVPVSMRLERASSSDSAISDKGSLKSFAAISDPVHIRSEVDARIAARDAHERKARWTNSKWLLLLSVTVLFAYGLTGFLIALLTWFRTWAKADVLVVAENDILVYLTLASSMCIVTALVGLVGTMLNSRPILAIYTLLLWPALAAILIIGYVSYRKQDLNLDRKLNQAWSQFFDDAARLRLQNSLHCCGYYSPLHQATFSKRCYPRTSLPGCKGKLYRFEKAMLHQIASSVFAVVPVHLFNIMIALLCSNHVNRTFGKGLMPRRYRLSILDVRENAIHALRNLPSEPALAKVVGGREQLSRGGGERRRAERRLTDASGCSSPVSGHSAVSSDRTLVDPVGQYRDTHKLKEDQAVHSASAARHRRPHKASPSVSLASFASLPRSSASLHGLGLGL